MPITKATVRTTAAALLGPTRDAEDVNPEYARAIAELTCDLTGISTEHKDAVLEVLHALDN